MDGSVCSSLLSPSIFCVLASLPQPPALELREHQCRRMLCSWLFKVPSELISFLFQSTLGLQWTDVRRARKWRGRGENGKSILPCCCPAGVAAASLQTVRGMQEKMEQMEEEAPSLMLETERRLRAKEWCFPPLLPPSTSFLPLG